MWPWLQSGGWYVDAEVTRRWVVQAMGLLASWLEVVGAVHVVLLDVVPP